MSSITSTRPTIVDALFSRSVYSDIALVLSGVVLTALAAQIQIPISPVPFTFQTLAVLLIGASYGFARAGITMATYALAGLVGIPVFAGYSKGPEVLLGATGGFILGFIFAAMLTGYLAERGWSKSAWKMFLNFSLGSILIYALGVPVLAMIAFNSDLLEATIFMLPYLAWDALKALIAGALLPSAWLVVGKIKKAK